MEHDSLQLEEKAVRVLNLLSDRLEEGHCLTSVRANGGEHGLWEEAAVHTHR